MHAWQRVNGAANPERDGVVSWGADVYDALVKLIEGEAGAGAAAAARRALAAAWPVLLPRPQMRAQHLIQLLPQGNSLVMF